MRAEGINSHGCTLHFNPILGLYVIISDQLSKAEMQLMFTDFMIWQAIYRSQAIRFDINRFPGGLYR